MCGADTLDQFDNYEKENIFPDVNLYGECSYINT